MFRSNPRRYSRHAITLQEDQKRALANRASRRRSLAATIAQTEEDGAVSESDSSSRRAVDRICGCVPVNNAATKAFKDMMDLSLLKDGVFIMFAVSNFLTSIGFNAPYVYTVVRYDVRIKYKCLLRQSVLSFFHTPICFVFSGPGETAQH